MMMTKVATSRQRSLPSAVLLLLCLLVSQEVTNVNSFQCSTTKTTTISHTSHLRYGYHSSQPVLSPQRHQRSELLSLFGREKEPEEATDESSAAPPTTKPIYRIVTRSDSKLPNSRSVLPPTLTSTTSTSTSTSSTTTTATTDDNDINHDNDSNTQNEQQMASILDRLDSYYQAQAHMTSRGLEYYLNEGLSSSSTTALSSADRLTTMQTGGKKSSDGKIIPLSGSLSEEKKLVSVTRDALEDAGFQLLSRRDLDLCESLNVGYLMRLSIIPDVKELDPNIVQEFYPELYHSDNDTVKDESELLFGGRVLVYWRGYSQEVTFGRVLLQKIDYLQASLVQRSAAWIKARLDATEERIESILWNQTLSIRKAMYGATLNVRKALPIFIRKQLSMDYFEEQLLSQEEDNPKSPQQQTSRTFKLSRYGGSKVQFVGSPNPTDALDPFTVCEYPPSTTTNETAVIEAEHLLYDELNRRAISCEYDARMGLRNSEQTKESSSASSPSTAMQLLERVSISNLVNVFTKSGRTKFLEKLFAKSQLVEPTFQEVVVVWRPSIKKEKRPKFVTPKLVSELADMFDVEGFERPPGIDEKPEPKIGKLQIQNFEDVPMANLPAVFPKNKLVFRPADAFLFDLISIVTFALVASSVRLDNSRLDLLALVSVSLWIFRTFIRYSNKLARYDLLVKTFLTSKISYRNAGALRHLLCEAGAQKAIRAALTHTWIEDTFQTWRKSISRDLREREPLDRKELSKICQEGVNDLLTTDKQVSLNAEKAFQDLCDLGLVEFDDQIDTLKSVASRHSSDALIQRAWNELLTTPPKLESEEDADLDDEDDDADDDDDDKSNFVKKIEALDTLAATGARVLGEVLKKESNIVSNAAPGPSDMASPLRYKSVALQPATKNTNSRTHDAGTLAASLNRNPGRQSWYF